VGARQHRRVILVATALLSALLSGVAPGISSGAISRSAIATRRPPMVLPGDVRAAGIRSASNTWIVAGRPGALTDQIARNLGAHRLLPASGMYRVKARYARRFARELRAAHRLTFAEPNALARPQSFPADPLTPQQWWLPAVVDRNLDPPPVTADSPLLAIIEGQVDKGHPDLPSVRSDSADPVSDLHATAVAGTASAAANGTGIVGVWPGMRVLDVVRDDTCARTVEAIGRATEVASVINMSYGFDSGACFAHEVATNFAFGKQVTLVASAGNGFLDGNPVSSPGADPHVITAAATDENNNSASFSSENGGVDVAAPGVGVLTTVPTNYDPDGTPDGYAALDGTSFSAPIVAAAAAWVIQDRPNLWNDQVTGVLRDSAVDLGTAGWDPSFGFGLLNLAGALSTSPEAHDPNEPNDDVEWIDGTHFSPDPPIFRPGFKHKVVFGRLDQFEDPADVYRIRVAAHQRIRLRLKPVFGDPDLEIYKGSASTIYSNRRRLARSIRSGTATDTITWTNRSRRRVTIYVDTYNASSRTINAEYHLAITDFPRR